MSITTLDRSFDFLEKRTSSLEASLSSHPTEDEIYADDRFIISLELKKLSVNVDQARSMVLDLERNNATEKAVNYRHRLKSLNSKLESMNFVVRQQQEKEQQAFKEQQKKDKLQSNKSTESGSFPNSELKNRKSGGHSLSVEQKLSIDKKTQEDLSSDLLSMVSSIKNNAIAFGEKVTQDNAVLMSTAESLNNTKSSIDNVGSRLKTYRSSTALSWWFYIWSTLFLILSVVLGMIIIRLFPKW